MKNKIFFVYLVLVYSFSAASTCQAPSGNWQLTCHTAPEISSPKGGVITQEGVQCSMTTFCLFDAFWSEKKQYHKNKVVWDASNRSIHYLSTPSGHLVLGDESLLKDLASERGNPLVMPAALLKKESPSKRRFRPYPRPHPLAHKKTCGIPDGNWLQSCFKINNSSSVNGGTITQAGTTCTMKTYCRYEPFWNESHHSTENNVEWTIGEDTPTYDIGVSVSLIAQRQMSPGLTERSSSSSGVPGSDEDVRSSISPYQDVPTDMPTEKKCTIPDGDWFESCFKMNKPGSVQGGQIKKTPGGTTCMMKTYCRYAPFWSESHYSTENNVEWNIDEATPAYGIGVSVSLLTQQRDLPALPKRHLTPFAPLRSDQELQPPVSLPQGAPADSPTQPLRDTLTQGADDQPTQPVSPP